MLMLPLIVNSATLNNTAIQKYFYKNNAATWIVFGKLNSENDDKYHVAIQFTKFNQEKYQLILQLIDDEKKTVLINKNIEAIIKKSKKNEWPLLDAFINYNPINKRWLIDVPKTSAHPGVHLNIDLNSKIIGSYNLLIAGKTVALNGHIKFNNGNEKDQFLSGTNLKYLAAFNKNNFPINTKVNTFICDTSASEGIFAINIDNKSWHKYLSGWEKDNKLKTLTGKISAKNYTDKWIISVAKPQYHLVIRPVEGLSNNSFIGVTSDKNQHSKCFISEQFF